ncbi:hypothetical protein [Biformimicrobium ophioploci]|uniref:Uncharacterized protein n=1 Tax=Biformimicrobium ophioploci TaxID=3036711 RepID=A0ABQ6LUT8_9GAMM|nr:hypothetical protein [Microbulbifer sp. NKW57]GMG85797.1 hypothetical protein MNKW57_01180 [Microbulbifer sp. NKW57]
MFSEMDFMLRERFKNISVQQLFERLDLPAQTQHRLEDFNHAGSDIASWIEEECHGDFNMQLALLRQFLPDLARWKASPANRMALADSLRPQVERGIEAMVVQATAQDSVPRMGQRHDLQAALTLLTWMPQIYAGICRDFTCRILPARRTHSLRLASLQCAIECLGKVVLLSARCYLPAPAGTWRRLHTLFAIATKLEIVDLPGAGPGARTARDQYLLATLFAGAEPARLHGSNQQKLIEVLCACAPLADIQATTLSGSALRVSLNQDLPPLTRSRVRYRGEPLAATMDSIEWRIDVEPIAKLLQAAEKSWPAGLPRNAQNVLLHLQRSWANSRHRTGTRHASSERCKLVTGVSHCCGYLNRISTGNITWREFLARLRESRPLGVTPVPANQVEDGLPDAGESGSAEYQRLAQHAFSARIVDSNSRGARLRTESELPSHLFVGQLLYMIAERGNRQLAFVRWISANSDSTSIGVEYIARDATPVHVAFCAGRKKSPYLEGLLIPGRASRLRQQSLLLPTPFFATGSCVEIFRKARKGSPVRRLQLTNKVTTGRALGLFLFEQR